MGHHIFLVVLGFVITFITTVYTADCYFNYKKSSGNEKKIWKRALEGWGILLFFIVLGVLADFSNLLSSINN